jgi:hypothetical protein
MGEIMNIKRAINRLWLAPCLLIFVLSACGNQPVATAGSMNADIQQNVPAGEVQVVISGGHDTDPRDGGRPVVLIASALGVPPEVFREAFSHVHPAGAGLEPNPIQVQLNKKALLSVLGPYGITNDRLDTVSNYYRFNGSAGETWPQIQATAKAIVANGIVTGFTITNPGSGYTSPPVVTLLNSSAKATAKLSFTTDFSTNGSLAMITLNP